MGEYGSLTVNGARHEVRKPGWLSGEWELVGDSSVLIHAKKISAFRRTFELTGTGGEQAVLQAPSAFSRSMELVGNGANCLITPVHAFTRRATIEGEIRDFRTVAFAFWLTVLLWRRATNSQTSS